MRRAFTLIEMLVTISVAAVLTGIAVSLLLVLFRAEQGGRAHVAQSRVARAAGRPVPPRRSRRRRRDCRTGKIGKSGGSSLTGDGIVQYAIGAGERFARGADGSKDVRRESYALPKDSTAAIAVDRATNPPVVSLTIVPNDASLRPGHEFRIDAVLGRDLRFAEQRKEGK